MDEWNELSDNKQLEDPLSCALSSSTSLKRYRKNLVHICSTYRIPWSLQVTLHG
jgi:hypothetical protein